MAHQTVTPFFIYSLPRSGSTLLQRYLGAHSQIYGGASEPHVALCEMAMLSGNFAVGRHRHAPASKSFQEFTQSLPNYGAHLRQHIQTLYSESLPPLAENYRFFIDKTPAYYHFASDLQYLFPHAVHIGLVRNPLAILASMIEIWGFANVSWLDLYSGPLALLHVKPLFRYEDLVTDQQATLTAICAHAGINYEPGMLDGLGTTELNGTIHDPKMHNPAYQTLNHGPLTFWRYVLSNPLRKALARRYLAFLGHEHLKLLGYNKAALLDALNTSKTTTRHLASDLLAYAQNSVIRRLPATWIERRFQLYPPAQFPLRDYA